MGLTRRQAISSIVGGSMLLGLRALVTGVPPAILIKPRRAEAMRGLAAAPTTPQFVIYSTSGNGDPINTNAPGTYDDPACVHAADASMAATDITQSGVSRRGAKVWSTLPQAMLDQLSFFHHGTYTIIHTEESKVMRLQGAVNRNDMLPSMLARGLGASLGTISTKPLCLYSDLNAALVDNGVPLPQRPPASLGSMLGVPQGVLGSRALMQLRDRTLDGLNAWGKSQGKDFQKTFLDQYALSQSQARDVQDKLGSTLAQIRDNSTASQIAVALAMFQLKLTPLAAITINFGGDNHNDGLGASAFTEFEVPAHQAAMATLTTMHNSIAAAGLAGQVSFLLSNVFGRNLAASAGAANGRGHNDGHAVSLLYGPGIRGGVVGGVMRPGASTDFRAAGIDGASGAASSSGTIPYDATLASMGKTFSAAAGLGAELLQSEFRSGSVVDAALA